jgi:hypothetical protein
MREYMLTHRLEKTFNPLHRNSILDWNVKIRNKVDPERRRPFLRVAQLVFSSACGC